MGMGNYMFDTICSAQGGFEGIIDRVLSSFPKPSSSKTANHPRHKRSPTLPILPLTEMKSGEGLCSTMAMDHSSSLM